MIMMPTYSGIMVCDDQKEEYQQSKGKVITCKYAETFAHRYLYIGALDNQNAMRHYGGTKQKVLLENIWITQGWAIRVFVFFISSTEVNSFLYHKYFLKKYEVFGGFRLGLVYSLTHNQLLYTRNDRYNLEALRNNKRVHHLDTAPSHAKKQRGQFCST